MNKCFFALLFLGFYGAVSAQTTIVVESIPDATPLGDTIFITGSFNNWAPNDPTYALERQINNQLSIRLPAFLDPVEYKFTRGSWTKVETDHSNSHTPNRVIHPSANRKVFVAIDNWLDLGGARSFNYFLLYFFAAAILAGVLIVVLFHGHRQRSPRFKAFVALNALLAIVLFATFLHGISNQLWTGYLMFIAYFTVFLWGPFFLWFWKSVNENLSEVDRGTFYPAGVALLFIFSLLIFPERFQFLVGRFGYAHTLLDVLLPCIAIPVNLYFYSRTPRQASMSASPATLDRHRFLSRIRMISLLALLAWPVPAWMSLAGLMVSTPDMGYLSVMLLSFILIVEAYYLLRIQSILKEDKQAIASDELLSDNRQKIHHYMEIEKPYRDPELSLADLAKLLDFKAHLLSRTINDQFGKNFRDFVNSYRIEEFIRLAGQKEFQHYTFLALAQEVGFNSKSTFNLAFKKHTGTTPRDYFKERALKEEGR